MATYTQLQNGSRGSDVKKLQESLVNAGYDVGSAGVDGIYGSATEAAVKKYQQDNGLAVDGIANNQTLGKLYGGATTGGGSSSSSSSPTTAKPAPAFEYDAYQPSDTVTQAEALLQQQLNQKPGAYQSAYDEQLDALMEQILNRDKFSYDLNGDALYQQYKDQYTMQGKMAMMDTMGQAAAMTGGYGNSYAQTAGQQMYQGYLQQLNEVAPDLYQMALNQYNQEGENLYNQFSLLGAQEEQDYNRYMDSVDAYNAELQRLYDQYNTERSYDYSKWADERDFAYGKYSDDRAYEYQAGRDAVADEQWQKEYDEMVRQYNQQYALSQAKLTGTGGPSDDSYDDGSNDQDSAKTPSDAVRSKLAGLYQNGGDAAIMAYMDELEQEGYDVEALYAWLTANYTYNKPDSSAKGNGALVETKGGNIIREHWVN